MDKEIEYPETELDLSMIACYAAMELQRRLEGKRQALRAVPALVRRILTRLETDSEAGMTRQQLVDPSTAVFMDQALKQAGWNKIRRNTQELLIELRSILNQLSGIGTQGNTATTEIAQLRDFCLAVSKRAVAELPSPFSRETHSRSREAVLEETI